ncbi:MAG: VWA domain-containing protein [Roseiflexaceae bacterium]|nr:VWA domain-containing protein [Roseiflexaceae bacterium]
MSLLAPLALLGAAIVGPLIIAMYLLKLRREQHTVSSTFLWQKMVRDVEANAPWQRLRRNWLLLLQLLILALLVLALARPFFRTAGIAGRNLIVIIDRSASMGATDVGQTRLAAAKSQAIALVDQLPDGGRATVIAAGGQMEVPAASTTDRRQLRDAINGIEVRFGGSDLSPALTLAAALTSREAESEVAIISDGNVTVPTDLQVPATVRYFPIGLQDANIAVSALNLQPSAAGQTLFAQATNYGNAESTRRMDIYLDGALFNAYNLTLGPGQADSKTIEIPAQVRVVEARLDESTGDALPLDDQAWAVSNAGDNTQVRIVGGGNRFLETALALSPANFQITTVPTSTSTFTETAAQVPMTILDGVVPVELPPGNLFFIAPPRSTEFFSVTGEVEFPALRPAAGEEPLLRGVSLSDVSVRRAVTVAPGSWARTVVEGDGGPVLLAGERDGRRVVVLTFDIHNSDLPLQIAFPLLISNIANYLVPGSGADAFQLIPGEVLEVQIDASITEVRITKPSGEIVAATLEAGKALFVDTGALGPYIVEQFQGNELVGRTRYAVNLFSADESKIQPRAELAVTQASGLQQAETSDQNRVGRQEIWRWLAAAALAVLVIEWLVYQRNGLAFLRDRLRRRAA